MKIRTGFVSNSSSSSYILYEEEQAPLTVRRIELKPEHLKKLRQQGYGVFEGIIFRNQPVYWERDKTSSVIESFKLACHLNDLDKNTEEGKKNFLLNLKHENPQIRSLCRRKLGIDKVTNKIYLTEFVSDSRDDYSEISDDAVHYCEGNHGTPYDENDFDYLGNNVWLLKE